MQHRPLGELLCQRKLITDAQLARLLLLQKKGGGRLGDVAVGEGLMGYRALYEALAEQHSLPFVDLLAMPPDAELLGAAPPETYLELRAIPWRRAEDSIQVAVTELSGHVMAWIKKTFGDKAQAVVTSPFDIRRAVEQHFGEILEHRSRLSLWQRRPEASAREILPEDKKQRVLGISVIAIALTAWVPVYTALLFIMICHVAYAFTMLFKSAVFIAGVPASANRQQEKEAAGIDEYSLPVYTVLIPMYREAESLPGMLEAIRTLDYPAAKLDIKLVLEGDDKETLAAALKLKPYYYFDIIRVPPSAPRTKPKACNYALQFARGEYVTIFDADDRPEKLQLKKAVHAFRQSPKDVVCLQARLNYYNANDNFLTRLFSLEYTILFHFLLYGLERLHIPIPLGGTSNHIALARLKELGEWDPYNVTEDADLGLRLATRGLKTRMLDSYTMEEAPNQYLLWIRQRSRWIKGYMQTWLVHMRQPQRLLNALGWQGFIGFQCFIGLSCFTFLTAPMVLLLSLLWLAHLAALHQVAFPAWLAWLTLINLGAYLAIHWFLSFYCASLYRKYRLPMLLAAIVYPLYLILNSVASYKSLWQLIVKPHFWEKTTHGLAKRVDMLAFERDIVRAKSP